VAVCKKCWQNIKDCKCNLVNNNIDIDTNIFPALRQLNLKGYKTEFSCGGHTYRTLINIYITFKKYYYFNILPKGFRYKKTHGHYLLGFTIDSRKLKLKLKEKQKIIDKQIKILTDWATQLKPYE